MDHNDNIDTPSFLHAYTRWPISRSRLPHSCCTTLASEWPTCEFIVRSNFCHLLLLY